MFYPDHPAAEVIARAAVFTLLTLSCVLLCVRVVGLRSFSKMTAFDFVATVATGSLLASAGTASDVKALGQALASIVALFAFQYLLARLRHEVQPVESLVSNQPVVLMRDGVIDEGALASTRVKRSDLIAKLREANALHFSQVRAVVLETTGSISVLHGDSIDAELLEGVRE